MKQFWNSNETLAAWCAVIPTGRLFAVSKVYLERVTVISWLRGNAPTRRLVPEVTGKDNSIQIFLRREIEDLTE